MMMLRRLELQAFGRFEDEVVEFTPGMNLVSGSNESGKTTLLQAVVAVLFGDDEAARFVPWETPGICKAALVVDKEGRQIRIERDFIADCVGWSEADADGVFQPVLCGSSDAGNAQMGDADPTAKLQELLGEYRRDIFQSLVYGDTSFATDGFSPEGLKACLVDPETAQFKGALKTLQAEYLAISSANPWGLEAKGEGELEIIARRLEELEKEWFVLQEMIRSRESQMLDKVDDSSDHDATVSADTALPMESDSSEPPSLDKEVATTIEDGSADASADYSVSRAELESELEKTGLPRCIPSGLPDLLRSCAGLRQAMAEQKRSLNLRQEERLKCCQPAWQVPTFTLLATWAAVCSWAWGQSSILPIGGGLVATVLVGAWYARRCLQARGARQELDVQVQTVEKQISELQQQLTDMNDRFEALGLSPSPVETVRMQKNLPRHLQLLERLRKMDEAGQGGDAEGLAKEPHLQDETPSAIKEGLALIPKDSSEEQGLVAACCMQGAAGSPSVDPMIWQDSSDLESLLDARSRIEAEGEELRARETLLNQRRNTLALECDLLVETLNDATVTDLNKFYGILDQVMDSLTAGMIEKVHVTDGFAVQLPGPDGTWLPVERFSNATRTLLRLALCLALNQIRFKGERFPLLLDDPLGAFDKKRRGQVLKVLEQYAAGQQVILFSHEDALRRRAMRDDWHLVSLRTVGPAVAACKEEKNDDDGQLSFL